MQREGHRLKLLRLNEYHRISKVRRNVLLSHRMRKFLLLHEHGFGQNKFL
ncbi:hypothetical protein C942_03885 [Photobacterium marinum]|uniref:Uncharacterized protein n=1 Tax=Photobacterium marinum TaxID=1056511 RepID=L8J3M8_9GAMM|nr:hypothetical protein C942_03885 [Photobacterium marinum]